MPVTFKPRKNDPSRPKEIRRKMQGEERAIRSQEPQLQTQAMLPGQASVAEMIGQAIPAAVNSQAQAKESSQGITARQERLVKKFRDGVIVEQTIQYNPGKGKPIIQAVISLTTALRGKRKNQEMVEGAYLLRLEVLSASTATRVEGFILGPWQTQNLKLETGSVYVAEPIWTAFKPKSGELKGRIMLVDPTQHRLLDLPLKTEAVIPGPEVFGN